MHSRIAPLFTAAVMVAAPTLASAALIYEETFNVAAGDFNGSTGSGSGFTGTWAAATANESIVSGGLSYNVSGGGTINGGSAKLAASGTGNPLITRDLSTATSADSVYVRVLFNPASGDLNQSDFYVIANRDTASTSTSVNRVGVRVSETSGLADFIADSAAGSPNETRGGIDLNATSAGTHLVVARYWKSISGAGEIYDRISVWVDPTATDSATPDFTHIESSGIASISRVTMQTANFDASPEDIWQFDELKAATTWAEVVPTVIPEPASLALLGLGSLCMLSRRRRSA